VPRVRSPCLAPRVSGRPGPGRIGRCYEGEQMKPTQNGGGTLQEFKEQLVKAARMYAMCKKAEVAEPMDVVGIAMAAFEDMPLKQALVLVRSNEQNVKDLAWAFENSSSAQEFEQRVKEIKNFPSDRQPR
jgi:hypothetical protein